MTWIILTLGAAFLWAVVDIIDKFVTDKEVHDPLMATTIGGFVTFFILTIISLINASPALPFSTIIIATTAGIVTRLGIVFYYMALSKGEVSRVVPVFGTEPIFVALLALLVLGEQLSEVAYIGIGVIVASTILISIEKKEKKHIISSALAVAVFTAVIFAIRTIMVKYATLDAGVWSVLFWIGIGNLIVSIGLTIIHHPHLTKKMKSGSIHLVWSVVVNVAAVILYTFALSKGPASLVSALSLSLFFFLFIMTTTLSIWYPKILKENITRKAIIQKSLAIVMLVLGVLLIT